jgi:8-oxo-dGTP pyrophosphatase MutT (NUDIX family)
MDGDLVASIKQRLSPDGPRLGGKRVAVVSVVLKNVEAPMLLLIRRAERAGDPWSGQIALPGGKLQEGDDTPLDTAARETLEEVGFDLKKEADFLGYAETTTTHTGTMEVVPAVFLLRGDVEVVSNVEVASFRWVGLRELMAPGARSSHPLNFGAEVVSMPALVVRDYVVWGLTHRILSALLPGP